MAAFWQIKSLSIAAAIRAEVCHSDACSLAQVQPCLALLIALVAARAAEDAPGDTYILQAVAAVATFGVVTW